MAIQPGSDPSATALYDLIGSQRITAIIYVAAKLGVADILAEGPRTSRELAQRTAAHESSLRRLLRGLVTIGVCKLVGRDQFELTAMGAKLAGNAEQSLKPFAIFEGELLSRTWASLLDSILSGKTAAELAGLDNSFERLAQNPSALKTFNEAMVAFTRTVIPAVLAAYDFSGITKLLDVGGGYGQLLSGILKAHPAMRGAIFDLPQCAEGARKQLADDALGERAEFIPGSFFETVPTGADAIIMKSIIHDWNDERSLEILANCHRALPKSGRLLLVERVMPDVPEANAEHCSVTLSDLNMLRGTGGSERTESEYFDLLSKGGFKTPRVLKASRTNVIEARVA